MRVPFIVDIATKTAQQQTYIENNLPDRVNLWNRIFLIYSSQRAASAQPHMNERVCMWQ